MKTDYKVGDAVRLVLSDRSSRLHGQCGRVVIVTHGYCHVLMDEECHRAGVGLYSHWYCRPEQLELVLSLTPLEAQVVEYCNRELGR